MAITVHAVPSNTMFWISRTIVVVIVFASVGTLLFEPRGAFEYAIDILFRTYAMFVGTVMAHEGIHGNLGRTRASNLWWGRIALLPVMVPFTNFKRTHLLHHAFTNIPDKDPDYFVRPRNIWEIPIRAIAMPHHWFLWLWKRGHIDRKHVRDLLWNYAAIFCLFGMLLIYVDSRRLILGMAPALSLVSLLLWYPFAVKTHEGFSTASAESRSHNYYGRFMYWFSLGLSMHRTHHSHPRLTWIELREFVISNNKAGFGAARFPKRDIRFEGIRS